ncbi:hypothetical protein SAMN05660226_02297 [Parapedobacter luteus]|uniref:Uncharacterized protein n=1 Tax=Parapedobacter luteus TaxID=623280 RepID=A0A1T5CSF1_9SPHI|nr:hypothetical protein SAMN05660226_02297 [Parapedobacter luteus]
MIRKVTLNRLSNVTTQQKIIKNKLGVLELAQHLGNVSKACKVMGYSREPVEIRMGRSWWFIRYWPLHLFEAAFLLGEV